MTEQVVLERKVEAYCIVLGENSCFPFIVYIFASAFWQHSEVTGKPSQNFCRVTHTHTQNVFLFSCMSVFASPAVCYTLPVKKSWWFWRLKASLAATQGQVRWLMLILKIPGKSKLIKALKDLFSYHRGYVLYQVTLTLYHIASQKQSNKMFFSGTRFLP